VEPVITVRAQLRSSLGAHSRDPLASSGSTAPCVIASEASYDCHAFKTA
jgi:hypothetical protein